jgi:hypothetical protein
LAKALRCRLVFPRSATAPTPSYDPEGVISLIHGHVRCHESVGRGPPDVPLSFGQASSSSTGSPSRFQFGNCPPFRARLAPPGKSAAVVSHVSAATFQPFYASLGGLNPPIVTAFVTSNCCVASIPFGPSRNSSPNSDRNTLRLIPIAANVSRIVSTNGHLFPSRWDDCTARSGWKSRRRPSIDQCPTSIPNCRPARGPSRLNCSS